MNLSIGVITHNDENILQLLDSVLNQESKGFAIKEVFVVSSGIIPKNEAGMRLLCEKNALMRVISESERIGKANAVNAFLKVASGDVCVLISGDIQIERDSIGELVKPFAKEGTGMVGGRSIPLNSESSFIGFAVNMVWRMHHQIALIKPKMGEFVAFCNIVREISPKTCVDEAWIEAKILSMGYKVEYAPKAVIHNMGPTNLSDYIKQRWRIHIGHISVKREMDYSVSSIVYLNVIRALIRCLPLSPKELMWTVLMVLLEAYIRLSAEIDSIVLKKNPYCWEIIDSAKIR
jgi:poly-beta-1,6-N-acetyl-D-glucosamine synthase